MSSGLLFKIKRFALIGIIATAIHMFVVFIGLECGIENVFLANFIAFACAFIFSFLGHFYFTFSKQSNFYPALWRFLIVALSGFIANNLMLAILIESGLLTKTLASVLAVAIIPVISFVFSNIWAFKEK